MSLSCFAQESNQSLLRPQGFAVVSLSGESGGASQKSPGVALTRNQWAHAAPLGPPAAALLGANPWDPVEPMLDRVAIDSWEPGCQYAVYVAKSISAQTLLHRQHTRPFSCFELLTILPTYRNLGCVLPMATPLTLKTGANVASEHAAAPLRLLTLARRTRRLRNVHQRVAVAGAWVLACRTANSGWVGRKKCVMVPGLIGTQEPMDWHQIRSCPWYSASSMA